mmetsp:Transcript_4473/g.12174  ORF Transcript_4473/g.12174 Transcript_4473/m.12174 type:complete len:212 (+) Transcript_4473:65-700(+)
MMRGLERSLLVLLICACCWGQCRAIKLKFYREECMTYAVRMYEPIQGSFVAMPDLYGTQTEYDLSITAPSGALAHSIKAQTESKFRVVPYESGRYKFCLTVSNQRKVSRTVRSGQADTVMWDMHVGHVDYNANHAKEDDTKSLWNAVDQVDAQLQQLRTTQTYLYWRERSHRKTIESTNSRVLWFAILRASTLVAASIAQVLGVRHMFSKK